MPELPEVETIRRTLAGKVEGRRITDIHLDLPRLVKWPQPDEFKAIIRGKTIKKLDRKGKYLLLHLDGGYVLVIHLRMTGRLYYVSADTLLDRFVRVIFVLDNGERLIYADSRTLGTLHLMSGEQLKQINGLISLGPEPLTDEFTEEYLERMLTKRQGKIKAVLLDQKLIGGLGNIYADECLALAGIHPERSASGLNPLEIQRLYEAINRVIEDGILHGGTSFRDYRDGAGQKGSHQGHLYVYGRAGKPCRGCGALIRKIEVGGRGTHYCPHCQA